MANQLLYNVKIMLIYDSVLLPIHQTNEVFGFDIGRPRVQIEIHPR